MVVVLGLFWDPGWCKIGMAGGGGASGSTTDTKVGSAPVHAQTLGSRCRSRSRSRQVQVVCRKDGRGLDVVGLLL